MATFLDISLLGHVRVVFVFILVFCIIYAVLQMTKALGESKAISVWIALSMAIIFSLVSSSTSMLDIIVPSFVMLILFGFVISVAFVFMGGKLTDVPSIFGEGKNTMGYWILIFTVIVFLAAIGKVFFDPTSSNAISTNTTTSSGSTTTVSSSSVGTTGQDALMSTIFHPKVLGFIVIMLVGTFTVMYMTKAM